MRVGRWLEFYRTAISSQIAQHITIIRTMTESGSLIHMSAHDHTIRQIETLGIADAVDVAGLSARRTAFDYVHFGTLDLPIGALFNFLGANPGLQPPRTGHIGNW